MIGCQMNWPRIQSPKLFQVIFLGIAEAKGVFYHSQRKQTASRIAMSRNGPTIFIIVALPVIFLGASVLVGRAQAAEQSEEQLEELYPVSLKCPAENRQELELISQNRLGDVQNVSVRYVDGVAAVVTVAGRVKDHRLEVFYTGDIRTEPDSIKRKYGEAVASRANALKAICEEPPDKRSEYFVSQVCVFAICQHMNEEQTGLLVQHAVAASLLRQREPGEGRAPACSYRAKRLMGSGKLTPCMASG
jgi:hypothetical protein